MESRDVVIGAHSATLRPTFDGYATLDFGPLLPRLRLPADQPTGLGVDITVRDTVTVSGVFEELIQRDAVIASQPEGEVAEVRVRAMAYDAVLRGAGAGLLAMLAVLGVWRLVGPDRRAHLREVAMRRVRAREVRPLLMASGSALAVAAGAIAVAVPSTRDATSLEQSWVKLEVLIPQIPLDGSLSLLEVQRGAATSGGVALVESAISTYNSSVEFYGALRDRVPDVAADFRVSEREETVALLVADRHNNIGMDPALRAIADAAGASLLINAGDDTSGGGSWEAFSVNSLADSFDGIPVVAVAGNHDPDAVIDGYREAGFTVLDGEPVDVEGIRFLGDSDPRSSGLTARTDPGDETPEEQGERSPRWRARTTTSARCSCTPRAPVSRLRSLAASTSWSAVTSIARSVRPRSSPRTATEARRTATARPAAFAFALGSALRRDAQVTLLTYRGGRPVGIQPVPIATDGTISVLDYIELPVPRTRESDLTDGRG